MGLRYLRAFMFQYLHQTIKGKCSYKIEFGRPTVGNIQRIHNTLSAIEKNWKKRKEGDTVQQQLKTAQEEVKKPFPKEAAAE